MEPTKHSFWKGLIVGIFISPVTIIALLVIGIFIIDAIDTTEPKKSKEEIVTERWNYPVSRLEEVLEIEIPRYTITNVEVAYLDDLDGDKWRIDVAFDNPLSQAFIKELNNKLLHDPIREESKDDGLAQKSQGWKQLENGRICYIDSEIFYNGGSECMDVTFDLKSRTAEIRYEYHPH